MTINRRLALGHLGAWASALMNASMAHANTQWPSRPIRMIVPFPAGAGPDVYARLYAAELSRALKVNVWVDNRPGASGILGTDAVAKSAPDGTTLLYGFNQLVTFNPHLFAKLPFNVNTDLVPVAQMIAGAYAIVANLDFPASNLPQLIEMARKKPGSINYASYGPGTASHLGFALIEERAGIELFHVPYKQGALVDVIAGQVPLVIEPLPVAMPQIKTGKVKAIAVTGPARVPSLPDVPSVAETLADFDLSGWHGIFMPAKTPPDIVATLFNEFRRITYLPEMTQRFKEDSVVQLDVTPEQFRATIAREQKVWGQIIRSRNIQLD